MHSLAVFSVVSLHIILCAQCRMICTCLIVLKYNYKYAQLCYYTLSPFTMHIFVCDALTYSCCYICSALIQSVQLGRSSNLGTNRHTKNMETVLCIKYCTKLLISHDSGGLRRLPSFHRIPLRKHTFTPSNQQVDSGRMFTVSGYREGGSEGCYKC